MILTPSPKQQFFGNNGRPLDGGLVFTYIAGTNTKVATYSDEAGTPNTNPIVLDFRGEANVWIDPQLTYKFVLSPPGDTDPPTRPIWSVDNLSALGGTQSVGKALYPRTDEEIAAGVTPVQYQWPPRFGPRYSGIVADGATDCTTEIATVANALAGVVNNGQCQITLPFNVLYNRTTLMGLLDPGVVIFDLTQINDLNSPGEAAKRLGIFAADTAVSDSQWSLDSGHHPVLSTNNHGTSGTASASKRLCTWLWAVGQFVLGTLAKRGDRGGAQLQFGKDGGGDFWTLRLVSFAPWLAIAANYERWETGQSATSGVSYTIASGRIYVAASTGTTGNTEPNWSSGTSSDGGVNWTYVDDSDRGVWLIDQYGRVLIGNGSAGRTYYQKVAPTDPGGGSCSVEWEATGVSQLVDLRLTPTTSGSAASAQPFLRAQDGVGLRVFDSAAADELARFSNTLGLWIGMGSERWSQAADGDTTPTVLNQRVLYTVNAGATSITFFDDGVDAQEVTIVATDANTTLVSSSSFILTGSINLLMTQFTSVTFKKVPAAIAANRWIETARSVK